MAKYGEYEMERIPMPAIKKNRLIFKKPVQWTSKDGRTQTTWDIVLTLELAPLQEELVMLALSLFEIKEKKAQKEKIPR